MEFGLYHGGPGSGRYPLGTGDRPYQHRGGSYRLSIRSKDGSTRNVSANRNQKDKVSTKAKFAKAKKDAKKIGDNLTTKSIKTGKGRDDITPGEQLSKNIVNVTTETGNLRRSIKNIKNRKEIRAYEQQQRKKISKMSDAELRKEIDRMTLERRYVELSKQNIDRGHDYVDDIFSGINSVALLTGSIVGTIALIRNLRRG